MAEAGDSGSAEAGGDAAGDATLDGSEASFDAAADADDAFADADAVTSDAVEEAPEVPPVFAGVVAVAPASATSLFVVWNPGVDPTSPMSPLTYRVYVGDAPLSFTTPAVTTPAGAVQAVVFGLQANTSYKVAVRALNGAGVEDDNTVELDGVPRSDTTPPTFLGVQSAAPGGAGEVVLGWSAAQDNLTAAAAIVYAVYESDTPGNESFSSPTLLTPPGAVSATVNHLPFATQARYFVVRAEDASGNLDSNTVERSSDPGPDVTPPVFAGCTSATAADIAITVAWTAAADDVSLPANIAYDIFESTTAGQVDFTQPVASVIGQTSVTLAPLDALAEYYFVCRARDQAGNEDANTNQISSMTGPVPTPPMFAGISGFMSDPVARTATISWTAGTDTLTPSSQLVYLVYESTTAGGESFGGPPLATSLLGATSITVQDLPAGTTLYFVVRAQDLDGEQDSNTVEQSFTTNISFSLNVQPILTQNCGVVGCHVPGNPTGGLILAPGFTYAQVIRVPASEATSLSIDAGTIDGGTEGGAVDGGTEGGAVDGGAADAGTVTYFYVNPGSPLTSFLNIKINSTLLTNLTSETGKTLGTLMPAPQTGTVLTTADLDAISTWITQGAPNN